VPSIASIQRIDNTLPLIDLSRASHLDFLNSLEFGFNSLLDWSQ
jgi:hypothetical protein